MGRDKANLPYEGTTLIERTVSIVGPRCSPVFVISAPGQPLPALEAEVLRDEVRGVGPLLATGRGLQAAADAGLELAFVCAVDMPLLDADLIDRLSGPAVRLGAGGKVAHVGHPQLLGDVCLFGARDQQRVDAPLRHPRHRTGLQRYATVAADRAARRRQHLDLVDVAFEFVIGGREHRGRTGQVQQLEAVIGEQGDRERFRHCQKIAVYCHS